MRSLSMARYSRRKASVDAALPFIPGEHLQDLPAPKNKSRGGAHRSTSLETMHNPARRLHLQQQYYSEFGKSALNLRNFYIFFFLLFTALFASLVYSFIRMLNSAE